MKTFLYLILLMQAGVLGAVALSSTGVREEEGPASDRPWDPNASVEALDRFLAMSDEDLAAIEAAIGRIRAMSSTERASYARSIRQYRALPQFEKDRLQKSWGQLDAAVREQWRQFMQSLDAEERKRVQADMQSLSPEDRVAWRIKTLREAGFKVEAPKALGETLKK